MNILYPTTSPADTLETEFAALLRDRTDEEIETLAFGSPAVHFAVYCQIRDKNNEVVSPVPNILQLRLSEAYETLAAMGVRVRIIATKPRRAGCSTFCAHILYHHGMRKPCEGIAIADKKEHSEGLLTKLKSYAQADSYPWGVKITADPTNRIEYSNGTKWTIDTAENSDAAVGDTNQLGLFSETSKWPKTKAKNDGNVMAAVLPTLSGSDTVAFSESTPEGATGWQYATWQDAWTLEEFIRNHAAGIRPEEKWVKVFAGWYEFSDNRRANPCSAAEIAEMEACLDEVERFEIERYGLDWEQIAWRRDIIESVCGGDPKKFAYYYPSDDVTCWLASGRPAFDQQELAEMEQRARVADPEKGWLTQQENGKVAFMMSRDGSGDIYVWERPEEGRRYIVTCDPAGDESQTIGADPDRHSVSVWRGAFLQLNQDGSSVHRPVKKVARLKPPYYGDGDTVAGHVIRLSKYYGHAMVALEINYGLGIMRDLKLAGIPLYKRSPYSHRTKTIVEQYGYKMGDKQERKTLIDAFASAIRERAIEVLCPHSVAEYKAFVVLANGRAEAAAGNHDDDCFVAGTRILTPDGEAMIETLRAGDLVITRDGPRRIARTFNRVKPVVRNLGLVGTADHPIITPEGEKPLASVFAVDTLYVWNTTTNRVEKQSFTEARNTTGTLCRDTGTSEFIFGDMTNGKRLLSRCIGRFGLTITDLFRRSISSITSMETRATTTSATWQSLALESTLSFTCATRNRSDSCGKLDFDKRKGLSLTWPSGKKLPEQKPRWPRMPASHMSSPSESSHALAADQSSHQPSAGLSIARSLASFGSIISGLLRRRRVYNLQVEGSPEYFANGILVHNCTADAMAWETLPSATEYRRHVAPAAEPPDRHTWKRVNVSARGW